MEEKRKLMIYLAGPMDITKERDAIAPWRQTIIDAFEDNNEIEFLCPELRGCDHTGLNMQETVNADISLLDKSNAVVCFLDYEERYGTVAEIAYAVAFGKPILLLINYQLMQSQKFEFPHKCDCCFISHPSIYWFLQGMINNVKNSLDYLIDVEEIYHGSSGKIAMVAVIKNFIELQQSSSIVHSIKSIMQRDFNLELEKMRDQ